MARRAPRFLLGNVEPVSTVTEEPRKTVRIYERLCGFAVERATKAPARADARRVNFASHPLAGLRPEKPARRARRIATLEPLEEPAPPPPRPRKRQVKH